MKVILAPATGECVLVSKKPQRVAPSSKQALGDKAAENKTRDVGVEDGDGDGVVNPEEPKVMVFDEVTVQELPHSCCVSWLFPLFENIFVNLLLWANAMCPPAVVSNTISTANVAIAIFFIL